MTQIRALLVKLSAYYQKTLTDEQIVMYAEDLVRFGAQAVMEAMNEYRHNPANKFFPIPAQLIELMERKKVFEELPAPSDGEYRCSLCEDTGWVLPPRSAAVCVAMKCECRGGPRAMAEYLRTGDEKRNRYPDARAADRVLATFEGVSCSDYKRRGFRS